MQKVPWSLRSVAHLVLIALALAFPAVRSSAMSSTFISSPASVHEAASAREAAAAPYRDAQRDVAPSKDASSTPNAKRKPFANPGYYGFLHVGEPLVLDASRSSDPYGQPLTYHWSVISLPAGSAAKLDDPTAVNPKLAPVDAEGTYVVQLVVSDTTLSSDPAALTLVPEVDTPVAQISIADGSGEIHVGQATQLDGTRSTDTMKLR